MESGILWYSQVLVSLLPLVCRLTVASSLYLHLYSTDDKTSRLMVKRFFTVRDTRRGSQSYMEKRRWRRKIEVPRRRRGGIKRRESKPVINSLCTLHSLDPSELFTELHREEKREEGDRGDQEEKRGNQKERGKSSQ